MRFIVGALVVCLLGFAGFRAGCRASRSAARGWIFVVSTGLTVLLLTALALNFRRLSFLPPFIWLTRGDAKWVVLAISAPTILGALAAKVTERGQVRALMMLSAVVVLRTGVLPLASPLIAQPSLREMNTSIDGDGVCLQSTSYTCGPAAAVTALRVLSIDAKEGELGLLCETSQIGGTGDDVIASRLRERYADQGLSVEHRYVKDIDELASWPASLAVIKYGFFVDHFVALLSVTTDSVVVGDPLYGRKTMPRAEFDAQWRHVAVLLRREKK